MEAERFDGWTKALAGGASRRRVLKGVGGGLLGAALAAAGRARAGAAFPPLPPLPPGLAYPPGATAALGGACPGGCVALEDASGALVCVDFATAQCVGCFEDVDCPAGAACIPMDAGCAGACVARC
jgi:hypothetical protein